ncbi:hypothetical protein OGAPHI_002460 [Ogataea philodendri]|uniref:Uncharacterized protein n=1 Tax=Ogataea philodendri TaxID=1378263 RepID=A0A9P8T875_9ASCO|nr:uncharacterized protein OGAPHI_002460 [Ogataea philodendri]KAH3668706.1 hypothetical protein OGAPHI_002460 [Ogataea philodendri]
MLKLRKFSSNAVSSKLNPQTIWSYVKGAFFSRILVENSTTSDLASVSNLLPLVGHQIVQEDVAVANNTHVIPVVAHCTAPDFSIVDEERDRQHHVEPAVRLLVAGVRAALPMVDQILIKSAKQRKTVVAQQHGPFERGRAQKPRVVQRDKIQLVQLVLGGQDQLEVADEADAGGAQPVCALVVVRGEVEVSERGVHVPAVSVQGNQGVAVRTQHEVLQVLRRDVFLDHTQFLHGHCAQQLGHHQVAVLHAKIHQVAEMVDQTLHHAPVQRGVDLLAHKLHVVCAAAFLHQPAVSGFVQPHKTAHLEVVEQLPRGGVRMISSMFLDVSTANCLPLGDRLIFKLRPYSSNELLELQFFVDVVGVLVLLVLAHKVVHVGFGFGEFHLVHTFRSVPVQERFSSEHGTELVSHSSEQLLDRSGVSNKRSRHVQVLRSNRTNGRLDVVWNPFHKVVRVLGLHLVHLVLNLLHRNLTSEESSDSQVSTLSWVRSGHHVLGIEHLLCQFWNSQRSERLRSNRGQWSVTNHEEVQSWEWHKVHSKLSQVGVQLSWETQRGGDTRHNRRNKVVQVAVIWLVQFQSSLADVIKRVPIPEPVPPPKEWVIWKPWSESQPSASLLTTSNTESTSSAPSVVDRAWLQIDQDCSWHVFSAASFVVVNVESGFLNIIGSVVSSV